MDIHRTLRTSAVGVGALALYASSAIADSPDGGASTAPQPIGVTVLKTSADAAPGLIFLTPNSSDTTSPHGGEIVDDQGRPVWFAPLPAGESAFP